MWSGTPSGRSVFFCSLILYHGFELFEFSLDNWNANNSQEISESCKKVHERKLCTTLFDFFQFC